MQPFSVVVVEVAVGPVVVVAGVETSGASVVAVVTEVSDV